MPADHAPASAGLKLLPSLERKAADVVLNPPRAAAELRESILREFQRGRVPQPGLTRAQTAAQLEHLAWQRQADAPDVRRGDVIEAEHLRVHDLFLVPAAVIAGEHDLPGHAVFHAISMRWLAA